MKWYLKLEILKFRETKIHILLSIWHFSNREVISRMLYAFICNVRNCLSCTNNAHTHTLTLSYSFHIVSDERILGHALIENEYYEHRLFIAVQRSMKWMVLIGMIPMFGFC